MKLIATLIAGVLIANMPLVNAAEKVEAGPKGGRILGKTDPKAEFFVEKDRTVSIRFYDSSGKIAAPAGQMATVIADKPGQKQTLQLETKESALTSKSPLPEGDGYNLVVQLRQTAEAKPQNFRFKYEAHTCGGCQRAEYACTCDE